MSINKETLLSDEKLSKKEIEKFVQSVWQPLGQSMVNFEGLLASLLLSRASQLRIDGDLMRQVFKVLYS